MLPSLKYFIVINYLTLFCCVYVLMTDIYLLFLRLLLTLFINHMTFVPMTCTNFVY